MRQHNPDQVWRKFCPPGHEDDFINLAERYQWQAKVDRGIRTALRMKRARVGVLFHKAIMQFLRTQIAKIAIQEARDDRRSRRVLWKPSRAA